MVESVKRLKNVAATKMLKVNIKIVNKNAPKNLY
jgi:hypothetical protein